MITLNAFGKHFVATEFAINTDYMTVFTVSTEVNNKVFGWKIHRVGLKEARICAIVDEIEETLMEVTLNTDNNNKLHLQCLFFNKWVGIEIER